MEGFDGGSGRIHEEDTGVARREEEMLSGEDGGVAEKVVKRRIGMEMCVSVGGFSLVLF